MINHTTAGSLLAAADNFQQVPRGMLGKQLRQDPTALQAENRASSQLDGALVELAQSLTELELTVTSILGRLAPVLTYGGGTRLDLDAKEQAQADGPARSELVRNINAARARVFTIVARLQEAHSNLEV